MAEREAILQVHRRVVAANRKLVEAGIGDERIPELFECFADPDCHGVVRGYAYDGARLALPAEVLIGAESEWAAIAVIVEEKRSKNVFTYAARKIGGVVRQVIAEIVLATAD